MLVHTRGDIDKILAHVRRQKLRVLHVRVEELDSSIARHLWKICTCVGLHTLYMDLRHHTKRLGLSHLFPLSVEGTHVCSLRELHIFFPFLVVNSFPPWRMGCQLRSCSLQGDIMVSGLAEEIPFSPPEKQLSLRLKEGDPLSVLAPLCSGRMEDVRVEVDVPIEEYCHIYDCLQALSMLRRLHMKLLLTSDDMADIRPIFPTLAHVPVLHCVISAPTTPACELHEWICDVFKLRGQQHPMYIHTYHSRQQPRLKEHFRFMVGQVVTNDEQLAFFINNRWFANCYNVLCKRKHVL